MVSDYFVTPGTVARQAPLSMEILQARILGWVAISSSRRSSRPRDQSQSSALAGRFVTTVPLGKSLKNLNFFSETELNNCNQIKLFSKSFLDMSIYG